MQRAYKQTFRCSVAGFHLTYMPVKKMTKIILTILIMGLILLTGCQKTEQQIYNKFRDITYLQACYDQPSYELFCECIGGKIAINEGKEIICAVNGTFVDIRYSNQLIQK